MFADVYAASGVTLAYAQSLEGLLSLPGKRVRLSCRESLDEVTYVIRARNDAILIGINTLLTDRPKLACRLPGASDPTPVILDSRGRFTLTAAENILAHSKAQRIVVCIGKDAQVTDALRRDLAAPRIAALWAPTTDDGKIDAQWVVTQLAARFNITSLMVEGGAAVIKTFSKLQVDHIVAEIAPVYLGEHPDAPRVEINNLSDYKLAWSGMIGIDAVYYWKSKRIS